MGVSRAGVACCLVLRENGREGPLKKTTYMEINMDRRARGTMRSWEGEASLICASLAKKGSNLAAAVPIFEVYTSPSFLSYKILTLEIEFLSDCVAYRVRRRARATSGCSEGHCLQRRFLPGQWGPRVRVRGPPVPVPRDLPCADGHSEGRAPKGRSPEPCLGYGKGRVCVKLV